MIRRSKITISTFTLALFYCLYIDSFACSCKELFSTRTAVH